MGAGSRVHGVVQISAIICALGVRVWGLGIRVRALMRVRSVGGFLGLAADSPQGQ